MNKNIFLYVGPHRSGSQFLLSQIFEFVPDLCNLRSHDLKSNDLVMQLMDEHPMFIDIDAYRKKFEEIFSNIEEQNILIGNEEFFGDYGKYLTDQYYVAKPFHDNEQRTQFLKALFPEAKIILTPRRQDLWIESAYMHFIHNYYYFSFDQFFEPGLWKGPSFFSTRSSSPSVDHKTLDWGLYLENYHAAFGSENVLVVPQEMVQHDLDLALRRFYEFMGLDGYFPDQIWPINHSYSELALKLALVFNRFVFIKQNRFGFIPTQPFLIEIQRMRKRKDNRLLWFLAGISRRINLQWFLRDVVSAWRYKRPNLLGDQRREEVLEFYRERNKQYSKSINLDLSKYGYY